MTARYILLTLLLALLSHQVQSRGDNNGFDEANAFSIELINSLDQSEPTTLTVHFWTDYDIIPYNRYLIAGSLELQTNIITNSLTAGFCFSELKNDSDRIKDCLQVVISEYDDVTLIDAYLEDESQG